MLASPDATDDAADVADPAEGITADGTIRTGAHLQRISTTYQPLISVMVEELKTLAPRELGPAAPQSATASVLLYGSVANGTARPPRSDVDAFTIGLPPPAVADTAAALTQRYAHLCRAVQLGASSLQAYSGSEDEAYGNRVFLKHYCVVLAGADHAVYWPPFPADVRAARGFNGDIAQHLTRWRGEVAGLSSSIAAGALAQAVARKTLLAVTGLVSIHDGIWTTDRLLAARRWSQIDRSTAPVMERLVSWVAAAPTVEASQLHMLLDVGGAIDGLTRAFADELGLWAAPAG